MKKIKQLKCECPETSYATDKAKYSPEEYPGMQHQPNECEGTCELKKYRRGDKTLTLCSCCCLPGDEESD